MLSRSYSQNNMHTSDGNYRSYRSDCDQDYFDCNRLWIYTHLLSSSDIVSEEPCEATEVPASELRIECESSGTVSVTNKLRL